TRLPPISRARPDGARRARVRWELGDRRPLPVLPNHGMRRPGVARPLDGRLAGHRRLRSRSRPHIDRGTAGDRLTSEIESRRHLTPPAGAISFAAALFNTRAAESSVTQHRARITWAPRPGGSSSLPTGLQYATIARFAEDSSWPNDAWSIVCAFDAPPVLQ